MVLWRSLTMHFAERGRPDALCIRSGALAVCGRRPGRRQMRVRAHLRAFIIIALASTCILPAASAGWASSCTQCHPQAGSITVTHPMACVECHHGNEAKTDKAGAHEGMTADPSDFNGPGFLPCRSKIEVPLELQGLGSPGAAFWRRSFPCEFDSKKERASG